MITTEYAHFPFPLSFLKAAALVEAGARLHLRDQPQAPALGAIAWIEGRGLLWAEQGAEHQAHVHLLAVQSLDEDGPDAVDLYGAEKKFLGTILADVDLRAAADHAAWRERLKTEAWADFWAAEIESARAG
jgi:hypothetical protein